MVPEVRLERTSPKDSIYSRARPSNVSRFGKMVRAAGIETATWLWKSLVMPLNYTRKLVDLIVALAAGLDTGGSANQSNWWRRRESNSHTKR